MSQPTETRSTASTVITAVLLAAIAALAVVLVIKLRHRNNDRGGVNFSNGGVGAEHPAVGRKLPRLELDSLDGNAAGHVSLTDLRANQFDKNQKGKVVLLNFWGTWCPPCTAEMPHLAELEAQFRDQPDFRFLAVSVGYGPVPTEELRQQTKEFMARSQYKFQPMLDPDGATLAAAQQLTDAEGIPLTMVIDRQGAVRGVWPGYDPDYLFEIKQMVMNVLLE